MKQVASLRYGVIFKKAFCDPEIFNAFVQDILGIPFEAETVKPSPCQLDGFNPVLTCLQKTRKIELSLIFSMNVMRTIMTVFCIKPN